MSSSSNSTNPWASHELLKVSLPAVNLPDCPDSDQLAGEYVLRRQRLLMRSTMWHLRFEPVCGAESWQAVWWALPDGSASVQVVLSGHGVSVSWGLLNADSSQSTLILGLVNDDHRNQGWPAQIQLTQLLPNALRTSEAAGLSGSSLLSNPCTCWNLLPPISYPWRQVLLDTPNYWDYWPGECCELANTPFTLTLDEDWCEWVGAWEMPLPCVDTTIYAWLYSAGYYDCKVHVTLRIQIWSSSQAYSDVNGHYEIPVDQYSPSMTFRFPAVEPDFGPLVCSANLDTFFILTPLTPIETLTYDCVTRNIPGCCPPVLTPGPSTQGDPLTQLSPSCCTGCGTPLGTTSGSATGGTCPSCIPLINATTGQWQLQFAAPGSGGDNLPVLISMTSGLPSGAPSGNGSMMLKDEYVVEDGDMAYVHKCDGAIFPYVCPTEQAAPASAFTLTTVLVYLSIGSNNNQLRKNGDGSWTEIQANGDLHQFNSSGQLTAIQQTTSCITNTWTIAANRITSPSGARTTYTYNGSGKLRRVTDPDQRITTFTIDGNGNLTQRITPELCITTLRYDGSQRLSALIDCAGLRTTYAYDTEDRVNRVTHPTGAIDTYVYVDDFHTRLVQPGNAITTWAYDAWSNVTSHIIPTGERSTYVYDIGKLATSISPAGVRTTYTYQTLDDGSRRARTVVTPSGRTTNLYDVGNSRLQASINALGGRTTSVYGSCGELKASIDPFNKRTSYIYESGHGLLKATINPLLQRTTNVYNGLFQQIASIDPLGNRTTYLYQRGQQYVTIDPLLRRSTTIYDLSNRVLAEVQPNAARTSYLYDGDSRLIATINPAGYRTSSIYQTTNLLATIDPFSQRTTYAYDLRGNQIRTTDPLTRINTTVYDASNRPVASITPLLARTTSVYNTQGQKVATINPLGYRNTTIYDNSGRPKSTINPLLARTTTVYNAAGEVLARVDAMNKRTTSVYDIAQRNVAEISPLGFRTSSIYDAAGRAVAKVNESGFRYTSVYDAAGQLVSDINPLLQRTTSIYDAAGQRTTRIDARTNRTSYTYDAVGHVVTRRYPDGARTSFTYDIVGNQTLQETADIRTTFAYDAVGRVLSKTSEMDAVQKTVEYQFNAVGMRTRMTDPDGGRFTYQYDAQDRLVTLTNPQSERTTFAYDAASRRTLKKLANNARTTYSYDSANNTKRVANIKSDSTTLSSYSYKYNAANVRTEILEADGARTTYSYDNSWQLTGEHRTGSNAYRNTYTYDARGNRTVRRASGVSPGITTSTFNSADHTIYSLDTNGRTTFTFDADGNQTRKLEPNGARTTSVWDYENKETRIWLPSNVRNTMTYGPDGLRIQLEDTEGTKKFIWDGQAYLSELDANNITTVTYTNEPTTYGGLISQRRAGSTKFHLFDALGSTRQLIDASQNITDTWLFNAWGELLARTGTSKNPFLWIAIVGYYTDPDTGNVYVRARIYDPVSGRWRSVDPAWPADGLNPFTAYFVPNNTDPSGLAQTFCRGAGGGFVFAIGGNLKIAYCWDTCGNYGWVAIASARVGAQFDCSYTGYIMPGDLPSNLGRGGASIDGSAAATLGIWPVGGSIGMSTGGVSGAGSVGAGVDLSAGFTVMDVLSRLPHLLTMACK